MPTFSPKTIAAALSGVVITGAGVTTALAYAEPSGHASSAPSGHSANLLPDDTEKGIKDASAAKEKTKQDKARKSAKEGRRLPAGVSTATSFWDPATASGKPMSYHTIASPYWPLGTKVKITYHGKNVIGVVEDFGPAEWAVAQHNPPAIIDLSEKMMEDLTGVRSNSVTIRFQVLQYGHGGVYRHSGTGYDIATGMTNGMADK